VLKIVDFGVSEMFDKEGEMKTAKSAGSPAFMPPELCVAKHGHVSGRAADIWSMGCTLYCLLFGRIPFEKHGMIELYQSIRIDPLEFDSECNPELKELLQRLMEKDPQKRITMEEIRVSLNRSFRTHEINMLGTPMGHAARDRSAISKVGERRYHYRTTYGRGSQCCHHRQHGPLGNSGRCMSTLSQALWDISISIMNLPSTVC
jgi:serine/threonine protein kinase